MLALPALCITGGFGDASVCHTTEGIVALQLNAHSAGWPNGEDFWEFFTRAYGTPSAQHIFHFSFFFFLLHGIQRSPQTQVLRVEDAASSEGN